MNETFCVLPWKHLLITAYGGIQICCLARQMVFVKGQQASLYRTSLDDIWNGENLRKIRIDMLNGVASKECTLCYENEANGLKSERQTQNVLWLDKDNFDIDEARKATSEKGETTTIPRYYQILISNKCNLACRMCNAEASSRIAKDPVHSAWAPGYNLRPMVRWKNRSATFGPKPHEGVVSTGLRTFQSDEAKYEIIGTAVFDIPYISSTQNIDGLSISLKENRKEAPEICITVNETVVEKGPSINRKKHFIDLSNVECQSSMIIKIDAPQNSEKEHLLITDISIVSDSQSKHQEFVTSRFGDKTKTLFHQDSFLFDELLEHADQIDRMYITGGEPFFSKSLFRLLDFLVDSNLAQSILMSFTSNGMVINQKLLNSLSHFKKIQIGLSIDGIAEEIEYIRYGVRWEKLLENIKRLQSLENVSLHAIPAVQILNSLNLSKTLRFIDKLGLPFGLNLVYYPQCLNPLAMPPHARSLAAKRLKDYADSDCLPQNREMVISIANSINKPSEICNKENLRKFMLLTNDLDAMRNQSIHYVFPELVSLIEKYGIAWTMERKHAPNQDQNYN